MTRFKERGSKNDKFSSVSNFEGTGLGMGAKVPGIGDEGIRDWMMEV